jgi:triacylglycerol lipase
MWRYVVVLVAAAAAMLAPAASARANDPILFVHGFASSGSTWNTMIGRFQADGYTSAELGNWSYNTAQSNATTASQLAARVNEVRSATGAERIDVITHSMGALSSRHYLKNLGGTAFVDDWVSLGGPSHGTPTAALCSFLASCREMTPGSSFLNALNSGDETPGEVNYGTWRSPCDLVVPGSSPSLSGATNTVTGCVAHTGLPSNATVYGQVREFVR